jgi:predicted RNase H-like HicB family nuclease
MADGATHRDALDSVMTVMDEWIETAKELGREIPSPKGRLYLS